MTVFAKAGMEAQRLPSPAPISSSRMVPAETMWTGNDSTFPDINHARCS